MVLVKLCVKNPSPLVNYHFSQFEVDDIDNLNFQELIEEVRLLPRKQLKKYKKIAKTFLTTLATFPMLPLRSMAESSIPSTTNLPHVATGMPPELLDLLLKILVIAVGASVILAAIMLVFAGVMRMFRKRKEANEWTVDIIKSLIQILVAVPVVFLIYYVSTLLFGGSGWHVNPF